jgi:hypothetical protein
VDDLVDDLVDGRARSLAHDRADDARVVACLSAAA